MIKCQICGRECKNFLGLSSHVSKLHNLKSKDYYDLYLKKDGEDRCLECDKETRYYGLQSGYNEFCSIKCIGKSKDVKYRRKKVYQERYKCDNIFQLEETKIKSRNTIQKKYNCDNVSQSKEIKEKKKQTSIKNFGVECNLQNKELINKIKEIRKNNFFNKLLNSDRLRGKVTPLFTEEEYKGIYELYSYECNFCGNKFEDYLYYRIPRCYKCFPNNKSKMEQECYEFLLTILNKKEIIKNNKNILNGKELDIYIPSKQLAIELNGLYWHSEEAGTNKFYHLNKTILCQKKDIDLIHIFEDEWLDRQDIIKDIIRRKLNLIENILDVEYCEIKEINNENEVFNFLDSNNLKGFIEGNYLGLYHKNELISVLIYDTPVYNKSFKYKIIEYVEKLNYKVEDGLKSLINHLNSKSLIIYVDRRINNSYLYEDLGFKLYKTTKPLIYNSYKYKIWNCGNLILRLL